MAAQPVKVLFAACREDQCPALIAAIRAISPELPLIIVSEFPREEAEWIPWHIHRSVRDNLMLVRSRLNGRPVRISATVFVPRTAPAYSKMRVAALRLSPGSFLAFDEKFSHSVVRPRGFPAIAGYLVWRARDLLRGQLHPGGKLHTWTWRFRHPRQWSRPVHYRVALLAGALAAWLKRVGGVAASSPDAGGWLPSGVSVIIPSRNGRHLLENLLPEIVRQLDPVGSEVIVVDNGSNDGTAAWLESKYPHTVTEITADPLSFARAIHRGASRARFSHLCLLNNDMVLQSGFFEALRGAFERVPNLFCATAQIFLPEGHRREETGKAVYSHQRENLTDFPVRCDLPVEGENDTYVLYGSGGCSLYDTRLWRALDGLSELFDPAYVEDLDLGFRAWRQGWPTVFVAAARVLHHHRATTSRYMDEDAIRRILEGNYLRFLAHAVTNSALFGRLWRESVDRVNLLAVHDLRFLAVLRNARLAPGWIRALPPATIPEPEILALGSGDIAVFPGVQKRDRPVVLVASPYAPFPLSHGGAVRMYNLMKRGAEAFDQVLVCFVDDLHAPPAELCNIFVEIVYVRRVGSHALPESGRPEVVEDFDRPAFHAVLKQTVRKWRPVVAQLEFTQMAQYAGDCAPARTVLVEHDITLDLYAQLLAQKDDWETRRQHERWMRFEQMAWGNVDRVVTMSEKDRRAVGRPNAVTIANGVDTARFHPAGRLPEPRRMLFIGSFAHLPNVLAIEWFLREVWPQLTPLRPTLHIIAGSRPEYFLERYKERVQLNFKQTGVELDSFVADVRPAYERAAVVIAPLLASAGTNIKIMEAMAMGKAIVSTPAGVNGLDELRPGHDVVVVDNSADMAAAIAALIAEPDLRQSFELEARKTAEQRYDWDLGARVQRDLYKRLLPH